MKIANCVLTLNGADIIDDVLHNCASYYFELGIDIYYFDASEDDSTGKVIEKYRAQGYTNLYHLHMPNASSMDRTNKMMSGELFNRKYDYIWPHKNRSYLSEEGLRDLLQTMRLAPDVIVLAPTDELQQSEFAKYTDPVLLYRDVAGYMTSLNAVIYKSTIFDNYVTQEYYVGFNEFYSYVFNKMPTMEKVDAIVIYGNTSLVSNSSLGHPQYNVLDVWKEQWINVNEQLPECYDLYKAGVIKTVAKLPWIIGNMERTYELCQQGAIREDNLDQVRQNWEKVSDTPIEVVEMMARKEFDLYHSTSYMEEKREFYVLIGEIMEHLKKGTVCMSQIPIDEIHSILLYELRKSQKCGSDSRLIMGIIEDIYQMIKQENVTIEKYCWYLQIYLSIGMLL